MQTACKTQRLINMEIFVHACIVLFPVLLTNIIIHSNGHSTRKFKLIIVSSFRSKTIYAVSYTGKVATYVISFHRKLAGSTHTGLLKHPLNLLYQAFPTVGHNFSESFLNIWSAVYSSQVDM